MARAAPPVDLFAPGLRADPYPTYRRLREEAPVLSLGGGLFAVTRYEDCRAILHDPCWSADARHQRPEVAALGIRGRATPIQPLIDQLMVFRDPPDHTRLRGLVHRAFSPRRVHELGERVAAIVDELLEPLLARDEIELISEFASDLPVIVVAELLGVPARDRERFHRWAVALAPVFEPLIGAREIVRAGRAGKELGAYLLGLVAERRRDPADDLLTALVQAEEEGDRLTRLELITNCALLLIAGHETTTNLIGNGMLALLRNPSELERLRSDPRLVPRAVEELLRYDSPVQMTIRTAIEDRELGGASVRAGESALLMLGSGNRDGARFTDPDRLDLGRPENRHLSFGRGPHYCLGNALARVEGAHAFTALVERLSEPRLVDTRPRHRRTVALRGLESLRIAFEPA